MIEWLRRARARARRFWVGTARIDEADDQTDRVNAALAGLERDIHELNRNGRPLDALAHSINQHRLRRNLREQS